MIHRAVNNVSPAHQFGDWRGIEAETLLGNGGDKTGARPEGWIIELAVAFILFEVLSIFRGKKGALVVIEPPGDVSRTGILEVHDGVLVSIEVSLVEQGPRAMQQA